MSEAREFIVGIDVGSVSAKIVALSRTLDIVEEHYIRTYGRPFETVQAFLRAYIYWNRGRYDRAAHRQPQRK